jgi:hypothetical protein
VLRHPRPDLPIISVWDLPIIPPVQTAVQTGDRLPATG